MLKFNYAQGDKVVDAINTTNVLVVGAGGIGEFASN